MIQYVKCYTSNIPSEEELYLEYSRIKFFMDILGIEALALIVTFQDEYYFDSDNSYHLTMINSVKGY